MFQDNVEAARITGRREQFGPGMATFTPRNTHLLVVKLSRAWLNCRIADRHLQHETSFGHFALLPQDADCSASLDAGVVDTVTLTIGNQALAEFADQGAGNYQPCDILRGKDLALTRIAVALERLGDRESVGRDELECRALTLIVERYVSRRPGHVHGLSSAAHAAVRAFIFDNIAGDLSLSNLARIAQISPYHFARTFSHATGVPPHRYIMQARTDQAAAAIRDRRGSLADIALAHGFTDQSHMCRWIRRRYGATPSEVRVAGSIG